MAKKGQAQQPPTQSSYGGSFGGGQSSGPGLYGNPYAQQQQSNPSANFGTGQVGGWSGGIGSQQNAWDNQGMSGWTGQQPMQQQQPQQMNASQIPGMYQQGGVAPGTPIHYSQSTMNQAFAPTWDGHGISPGDLQQNMMAQQQNLDQLHAAGQNRNIGQLTSMLGQSPYTSQGDLSPMYYGMGLPGDPYGPGGTHYRGGR